MTREAIPSANPLAAYSGAVIAEGKFVFVAGQGPLRDGEYVPGTVQTGPAARAVPPVKPMHAATATGSASIATCLNLIADLLWMLLP